MKNIGKALRKLLFQVKCNQEVIRRLENRLR